MSEPGDDRLVGPPRGPVLKSATNPTGWRLEELLPVLRDEIRAKCAWIEGDASQLARTVRANNEVILGLFAQAELQQRGTIACLAALGPDPGPRGTPRIGTGSAGPATPGSGSA